MIGVNILKQIVDPWYKCLKNPAEAQQKVLENLIRGYAKTVYGKRHSVEKIKDSSTFRTNFPTINYVELRPYLEEVKIGKPSTILPEPPLCWVMTRGSTGTAKMLPVTKTHIDQIFKCGARAITNYALRKKRIDVLAGKILNLNFVPFHTSARWPKFMADYQLFNRSPILRNTTSHPLPVVVLLPFHRAIHAIPHNLSI